MGTRKLATYRRKRDFTKTAEPSGEGAPVSMPLRWPQVKAGLDPSRYTMRTARELLAKSKAWEDYCEAVRPLEPAIRKLVGSQPKRKRASADTHARA